MPFPTVGVTAGLSIAGWPCDAPLRRSAPCSKPQPGPCGTDEVFSGGTVIAPLPPLRVNSTRSGTRQQPASSSSRALVWPDLIAQYRYWTAPFARHSSVCNTGFRFQPLHFAAARAGHAAILRACGRDVTKAQASHWNIYRHPGALCADGGSVAGRICRFRNALDPKLSARLRPYFIAAFPRIASSISSHRFGSTRRSPAFWSAGRAGTGPISS